MERRSSRLSELDSLRGVAALCVVAYHYTYWFGHLYGWPHGNPVVSVPWGHYGVNLFFVISGFVITASTAATPRPVDFAVNRVARLYPAYIGAVLLSSALAISGGLPGLHVSKLDALVNLTMLQRQLGIPDVDRVYWTLALEMMFYAFVFLLLACRWWARPARDWFLAAWAIASLGWTFTTYSTSLAWSDRPVAAILYYGPLFLAGVLIKEGPGDTASTRVPFALTVVAGAVAFVRIAPSSEVAFSAGAIALVLVAVRLRPAPLRWRPLVAVGEASYVLYLIHWVPGAFVLLKLRAHVNSTLAVALMAVVVIAASVVVHQKLEVPANRWLRRALRSPKAVLTSASAQATGAGVTGRARRRRIH